jgi:ABC-2 type transport system permease protein
VHPIIEITIARLKEFYREPGALFWVFVFPVFMAVVLGIAFGQRPPSKPKIAVVDTAPDKWVLPALGNDAVDATEMTEEEARLALKKGSLDLILKTEVNGEVTYIYDATLAESRIAKLTADHVLNRVETNAPRLRSTDVTPKRPGTRYIDFLIPGLIGLNIMGGSMWGVGYALVLARKHKVLRRLAATPMRRSHFLIGYMLFRVIFLSFELAALLIFGYFAFDVIIQGSVIVVIALGLLGALAFTGMGLMVAARIESLEAANGWLNFIMLPSWLLSGAFFSYTRFPEFLHSFIQLLPLTALNDGVRMVYNEGASLIDVSHQILVLVGWGIISFVVALRIFRWQ